MAEVVAAPPPLQDELEHNSPSNGISHAQISSSPPQDVSPTQPLTFPKLNEIRRPQTEANETSICYQFEDNDLPILIRYPIPPDQITLRDLKKALSISPMSDYKFFFRSYDKDVGDVNEEIADDNAKLPFFNRKVVVLVSFPPKPSLSPSTLFLIINSV